MRLCFHSTRISWWVVETVSRSKIFQTSYFLKTIPQMVMFVFKNSTDLWMFAVFCGSVQFLYNEVNTSIYRCTVHTHTIGTLHSLLLGSEWVWSVCHALRWNAHLKHTFYYAHSYSCVLCTQIYTYICMFTYLSVAFCRFENWRWIASSVMN